MYTYTNAGSSVLLVFEHDLTMDALLENGLSDIRCCYHSNIIYQVLKIGGYTVGRVLIA